MIREDVMVVVAATPADVPAITALWREAGLPHGDGAVHVASFLVARHADGAVVGAVSAEVEGGDALLRSLVAPAARGGGLGGRLVDELERRAAAGAAVRG